MRIHHIFLLLLSWQSARAIENETAPPENVVDQVATASESRESFEQAAISPEVLEESSTTADPSSVATIHYENSNGFVPMTLGNEEESGSSLVPEVAAESGERESTIVGIPLKSIEDDPVYTSEARMFFGLPGPSADRRSFDAQDIQGQFEILKVNDETPAIANYQEFYDNVQNNLNSNRGGQATYEDYGGRTESQNKRTKERIKQIDKYLTNFQGRDRQPSAAQYDQYYNNYPDGNARPRTRQKDIFEPAKVQAPEQPSSTGYDENAFNSRSQYSTAKNRYSKPVVVVEPSDYKIDMKFGSPQVTGQVTSLDDFRDQKHRKTTPEVEQAGQYDEETRLNREDRYGMSRESVSNDYSSEQDYLEITEKPRRMHTKSRRRPHATESSRRLPKEHRGNSDPEVDDSRRNNSHNRSKPQRPRTKPIYWTDDGPDSEETSDERPSAATPQPNEKNPKQSTKSKTATSWNQVGPNIEVSHSNGFEIGQIDKPKQLLVPVNLNLLPLGTFDHSAAIGNSQGFDFTNVPNFITATPMLSTQAPLLSTSHSLVSSGHGNAPNQPKIGHHTNNNYGQTAVPDIIVGQNTYHNSVQAVLLPHMNINGKFATNLRPQYTASTVAPMFTVTHTLSPNFQNVGPTMAGMSNYQSTPRPGNAVNQNVHQMTINPAATSAVPQLLIPQPTLQTLPVFHAPYNTNILVNPNGLHGQNAVQPGNPSGPSGPSGAELNSPTTTPQPLKSANNYHETQPRRNNAASSNAQFVTTASLAVANIAQQGQQNIGNDHKYYLSSSNPPNSNTHFYSLNQNLEHASRPQQQENFYHIYRDDQNPNGKIKTYMQTAQVVPAIIHQANGIPVNLHHQNYANVGGQLQEQQSILSPSVVLQRPRDQNQQILNAANDIFENTWKQLQQLRSNEDTAARRPYQHVYGMSDNFGATSNANANTVNGLPITNVNTAKAHLPILSTQNVEIVNPNIKPSPVDLTIVNPYHTLNHYQGAILTTPVPIFGTSTNFLAGRPVVASTTPAPMINIQSYVDQLSQIGAQSNRANSFEPRPASANQNPQRQLFNPINFVPNSELMKSQSMLNSKNVEPLPDQLSLVPLVPGGNFFKNSQGAQTELQQKPRLSSDLEKYADEMFRESLKTIYSTHKWNNDVRAKANYSSPETSDLAKLRTELQRFKASMPDPKYGKDVLEAHHSETSVRTAESSSHPTKKPELSMSDIEELFKSDFKQNLALEASHHGSHQKNRPGHHGSSRPSSSDHSTDFRNYKHLSNYLTPPKFNSYMSKIPFAESPKSGKKRPGSSVRYNAPNGRPLSRPNTLVSRPASSPDASASNHLETGLNLGSHHRYEKHRSYPTFTTTSSPDNDSVKSSSSELFSKNDYYDINHPRMHNLLGLLMKNKQLPRGSSQSYMRNMDDQRQYFDDERRRVHLELDPSINMGPPAPPYLTNYRPYPNPGSA